MNLSEKFSISPAMDKHNVRIKPLKLYPIVNLVLVISGCVYSVYGIVVYFLPVFRSTSALLRLISEIALSTLNVVTIAVAAFNLETWNNFLNLFKYLDDKVNTGSGDGNNIRSEKKNFLLLEITFYHFMTFCVFIYEGYVWYLNYGWDIFRFCLFRYFHLYHCVLTMLVVFHFASALRGRYKRINTLLVKTSDLHNVINNFIPKGSESINNLKSIREVTDYYLLLSELVDMFNKLFGWQIFFVTENIILLLLEVFNFLTLSIDYTQKTSDAAHNLRTIFFLTSLCILLIVSILL